MKQGVETFAAAGVLAAALSVVPLPSEADPDRGAAFVRFFDGNGDQIVTLDEVDAAQMARFDRFDANGDHLISIDEAREAMQEREWGGAKNPSVWLRRLDRDGDNRLSVQEYVDRVVGMMKHMDANENGEITRTEVNTYLQARASRPATRQAGGGG